MDFENTIFHPSWFWGLTEYIRRVFLLSSVRTAAITAVPYLLINVLMLRYLDRFRIQSGRPSHRQTRTEFKFFVLNFFIFHTMVVVPVFFMQRFGHFRYFSEGLTWWRLLLELTLALVAHDTYFYWTHRLLHKRSLFRLAHDIHHRSTNPTVVTSYSFHPTESVINSAYIAILFAAAGWIAGGLYFQTFMLFMLVNSLWNVYIHSGLEIAPRSIFARGLLRPLATSTHHNLHHSHNNGNYGLYFSAWDRLCGTLSPNYEERLLRPGPR